MSIISILAIPFILLLIVGVVFLQIYLSKRQNKWLGLIFPFITFFFSVSVVLGFSAFFTMSQVVQDGKAITTGVNNFRLETFLTAVYMFVIYNIPTAILLGIYGASREKTKKNAELEKMNIQDL